MSRAALIAIDWGTTHRRIYVLDEAGELLEKSGDDRGIAALSGADFPAEMAGLRQRFGDCPAVCAGMIGSDRGWMKAPYVPCPATLEDIAAHLAWCEERTAIVPGVSFDDAGRCDVMRGEEVQILGAVECGFLPSQALVCQPGTHGKWAHVHGPTLTSFRTAMTGELYGLLKAHSLLAGFMQAPVAADDAFLAGVLSARGQGLLGSLFEARAATMLGRRTPAEAGAMISGKLVGCDIVEQGLERGQQVELLADGPIGDLYEAALLALDCRVTRHSSETVFLAGIKKIWRSL